MSPVSMSQSLKNLKGFFTCAIVGYYFKTRRTFINNNTNQLRLFPSSGEILNSIQYTTEAVSKVNPIS